MKYVHKPIFGVVVISTTFWTHSRGTTKEKSLSIIFFTIQNVERQKSSINKNEPFREINLLCLDTLTVESIDEAGGSNPVRLDVTEEQIKLSRLKDLENNVKGALGKIDLELHSYNHSLPALGLYQVG
jgi:hypothetical protein